MAITTASQSQLGQDTAKNSQVVTTVIKNFNSGTLGSGPSITSVIITDSNYNNLDDTAVTTSNGYIKIIGTGFTSTANVYVGSSAVPAANVTFVSSTEIRARVPVLSAGNYSLSLFNSNSSGTISSSTFIVSTGPAWVTGATLSNQVSNTAFAVALSATSDTSITYANTSALPAGTTLAANGYFSGTVSIGTETTYSFDVKATDTENQDASRTFSLTVTVIPPYYLYSWGKGSDGALGLNDTNNRSSPVQVGAASTWLKISSAGNYSSGALKTDGTLWTWGQNLYGQLGQNDQGNSRSSPVQVGTETNWNKLEYGAYAFLMIKTDGTLWSWGYNQFGGLGHNNTINKSSPTQVGSANNWSQAVIGNLYSATAVKTDGTLWSWGYGFGGGLGLNDSVDRSSPVQVGSLTNWSNSVISRGFAHAMVIKSDGTLWAWGYNADGQLGTNNTSSGFSSPVQVGPGTNWSNIAVWNNNALATKTDGTLWAWGNNTEGQLGTNDRVFRSSPVQIGSGTNWSKVSTAQYMSGAIKTDGTLWLWGNGTRYAGGALGLNDAITRSSPTQVGTGTTWLNISVGYRVLATRST
jgi:alpha-tubulin suppressor-like RCC1 family protein